MSDNRWSGVHGKNSGLDGDKTSTGAVCYAGSQGWSVNGRRKLYVGDKTSPCPKCGQPGVIASGDLRQTNPQGRVLPSMVHQYAVGVRPERTSLLLREIRQRQKLSVHRASPGNNRLHVTPFVFSVPTMMAD
ncbi:PAAR domain-containing protein [Edwardsiella tarda]|uniref:PAAR domain-containing protein n=1 Tax=Edwardsiella tarda TaxID=636 RepID=UPI000D513CA9